jgi:nitroimidazol reductase NimA-like FMN-containing flavoprotein (pyridoxamine 5'-phosphate oxidase superfamily)
MPKGYGVPENNKGLLPWSHIQERMSQARNYWISTTRPDSRPHATPVWGCWLDDVLYIEGGPDTRRGRNLAANPAVAVHLESGDEVVILEGEAQTIPHPDATLVPRLVEGFSRKYAGYKPNPEMWEGAGLYAIRPRVVIAWTQFPKDATRWKFEV